MKKILIFVFGLSCGIISMVYILKYYSPGRLLTTIGMQKPAIIGFLPYWLINKDGKDYTAYVNTISYFGLTIDKDGGILKRTKPTETELGWLAMQSGKINPLLDTAKKKNLNRSLVVFSADQESINLLMEKPVEHAQNLMNGVLPILDQFGFTDLNIDIENFSIASEAARQNFTLFTKTIHNRLQTHGTAPTLSIDVSPTALIKPYLINIEAVSSFVDKVIFMTYDFHFQGSSVTGAVSPINGAEISAEFDAETSVKEALKILRPEKIILGVPLYGYEWETLADYPHAATIPNSGITASNRRIEELLAVCATCSAQFDAVSKESYLIYKDQETNTFHQFFYPDKQAMQEKINLMRKYDLGGIALWALGYEGNTILDPLKNIR